MSCYKLNYDEQYNNTKNIYLNDKQQKIKIICQQEIKYGQAYNVN